MLEGLLVDLVPYDARFLAREHVWHNDQGVFYWAMGDRWLVTQAAIEHHQQERTDRDQRERNRVLFGMQTKDGIPIGLVGIRRWHTVDRVASLTALIGDPAYWGGGYGTDALLLLADYAFECLDVRKLELMTMSLNVRVMRQMEKVKFALEARRREATYANGEWYDALVYGLLREEWPGRDVMVARIGLQAR
jgi:RimJ/RimL family protein N-acetyltransferase